MSKDTHGSFTSEGSVVTVDLDLNSSSVTFSLNGTVVGAINKLPSEEFFPFVQIDDQGDAFAIGDTESYVDREETETSLLGEVSAGGTVSGSTFKVNSDSSGTLYVPVCVCMCVFTLCLCA